MVEIGVCDRVYEPDPSVMSPMRCVMSQFITRYKSKECIHLDIYRRLHFVQPQPKYRMSN